MRARQATGSGPGGTEPARQRPGAGSAASVIDRLRACERSPDPSARASLSPPRPRLPSRPTPSRCPPTPTLPAAPRGAAPSSPPSPSPRRGRRLGRVDLARQGRGARRRSGWPRSSAASITAVVSASGTLKAVTTVQVGSQISGPDQGAPRRLQHGGQAGPAARAHRPGDLRDQACGRRKPTSRPRARRCCSGRATPPRSARSSSARRITHEDAKRDLDRKESLVAEGLHLVRPSATRPQFTERGAAEAIRTAEAQVRSADAQVANAAATVKQREAALASARNDLEKTAITAPVDGVVISRQVDAGQTVAASLNTPTLFTIAAGPARRCRSRSRSTSPTSAASGPTARSRSPSTRSRAARSRAGSTRSARPRRRCRTSSPTR